jgi:hypothetical protein
VNIFWLKDDASLGGLESLGSLEKSKLAKGITQSSKPVARGAFSTNILPLQGMLHHSFSVVKPPNFPTPKPSLLIPNL